MARIPACRDTWLFALLVLSRTGGNNGAANVNSVELALPGVATWRVSGTGLLCTV